jgi:hypothetical protein
MRGENMRQKIENNLYVEVNGANMAGCTNLEFYVKQDNLFFQYTPVVQGDGIVTVTVPYDDAMKLRKAPVKVQLAFTDENGLPVSSAPVELTVGEFLKEAGYGIH